MAQISPRKEYRDGTEIAAIEVSIDQEDGVDLSVMETPFGTQATGIRLSGRCWNCWSGAPQPILATPAQTGPSVKASGSSKLPPARAGK